MNLKKMKNMLTKSQINNLKKGDKLLAEVTFMHSDGNNDLICSAPITVGNKVIEDRNYYCLSCLSLPPTPPKHDPTRPFKKGDIVKPVERWGRKVPDAVNVYGYEVPGGPENKEWVVQEAETFGMVEVLCKIRGEYCRHKLPFFHLELVTPVEEIEPYSIIVQPEDYHCVRIMKGTKIYSSIPFDEEECVCRTLEEAKAAAETERDRLNAEHRKEQSNG